MGCLGESESKGVVGWEQVEKRGQYGHASLSPIFSKFPRGEGPHRQEDLKYFLGILLEYPTILILTLILIPNPNPNLNLNPNPNPNKNGKSYFIQNLLLSPIQPGYNPPALFSRAISKRLCVALSRIIASRPLVPGTFPRVRHQALASSYVNLSLMYLAQMTGLVFGGVISYQSSSHSCAAAKVPHAIIASTISNKWSMFDKLSAQLSLLAEKK